MKRILTLASALLCCLTLLAVPARPGFFRYVQPDGSAIMLQKVGDEFGHMILNEAGEAVELGDDGFYHRLDSGTAGLRRSAMRIRRAAARRLRQSRAPAKGIAFGQKHFLVILVEFSDLHFTVDNPNDAFTRLLNQPGYSGNGAVGSARDYYYENSHGFFEPVFDVYGPVEVGSGYAYYGANDSRGNDLRPHQAVIDACKKMDPEIDFSRYDLSGDGYVDMVFMYYAGYGEADYQGDRNVIWPHQWYIEGGAGVSFEVDGVKLDSYACTNELNPDDTMCGIGTACHEFGHAMGLPDFYDTDYAKNGEASALFEYSLMCSGSYNNEGRTPPYFNMVERIMLGWLPEDSILDFKSSGTVTIPPVNENVAYRTLTDMAGESFVYECRGESGWDAALPGHGLLVYHMDRSSRPVKVIVPDDSGTSYVNKEIPASELWSDWEEYNSINENGSHPCFYLVPSKAQDNTSYSKYFSDRVPFPGSGTSAVTSYIPLSWNGISSLITFSDISYGSGQVSLNVTVPLEGLDYNVIANPKAGSYSVGDRFSFALTESAARPVSSAEWFYDDEPVSSDSVTLTSGAHTVEARLLLKNGKTKIVTLEITVN